MTTIGLSSQTPRALARLALVLLATAAGCSGTTSPVSDACPAIAATGGNPVGTWVVTDSCQQPYAQTMTPDWCSQLVYTPGTAKDGLFLGQAFLPLDTTTGTVKIRAEFDNADNALFPNQFVNARVLIKTLENAVTVPTSAIQPLLRSRLRESAIGRKKAR